jgi:hypothetical protein
LDTFNLRRSPLRDLREQHEIAIIDAADALGVHANAVAWLEAHTCVIEPATWESISELIAPDYGPSRFLKNVVGFALDDDSLHADLGFRPDHDGGEA